MKTTRKILKDKCLIGIIILSITAIAVHVLSVVYHTIDAFTFIAKWYQFVLIIGNVFIIHIAIQDDDKDDELLLIEISEIEHMSTDEILRLSKLLDGRRIGPYEKEWGREKLVYEFEGDVRWHQLGYKK